MQTWTPLILSTSIGIVFWSGQFAVAQSVQSALPDLAMPPPGVTATFDSDTGKAARGAQGVPTIERTANGRLWAAWYASRSRRGVESCSSYVVLATSSDDGHSWSESLLVRARRFVHTYDPCLWMDPRGRLWFFWAQSAGVQDGRMGGWAILSEDPEAETALFHNLGDLPTPDLTHRFC